MARGSNEHRMVFDIRGRRRHVVKFVYAILALLMVASLFLVTGAVNLNSILGTGASGESATASLEKQAENVEAKLRKTPEDEDLLASLARTRANIANTMVTAGAFESQQGVEEVDHQLAQVSEDWSRYLKAAKEPSAGLAIQVAPKLYESAVLAIQLFSDYGGAIADLKSAVQAQKIVVESRPSVNSWSTLAIYAALAQENELAEEAKEETVKLSGTKFARESFENQYKEYEKKATELAKAVKSEKASKSKSAAKESLENPLGGLGGSSLSGE
jgi:hypothetical protein